MKKILVQEVEQEKVKRSAGDSLERRYYAIKRKTKVIKESETKIGFGRYSQGLTLNAKLLKTATAMLIPTPTVKHSILLHLRKQRGNKGIAGQNEPAGNEFRGINAITHEQIFFDFKN